ncbi:MAG: LysM peptidoglycan-binding domain-containing protein [Thermincola sp.]|jgi:LysM repeat protein|nr:LysM peptidoglycan-binding domain-containing protein [Thermincola sp.]MDT3703738.1 LysM peptidoglycan-binding domain-containing protein [Thermincola sp.]
MPQNLYYVQPGDTLYEIATRFGVTVEDLLKANVICNPNLIFIDQPLIIPTPGLELPKAGGGPYYVVLPGDTLYCLAGQFNTTIQVLAAINQMFNPNILFSGVELLIGPEIPDANELRTAWVNAGRQCDTLNSLQIHNIFYIGSFQWTALGRTAVPCLLDLLKNTCETVRLYAVISLGRLALNRTVRTALRKSLNDTNTVAAMAELALRRIDLAARGQKRVHLTTAETYLAVEPFLNSTAALLPQGTEVIVTRWNIPSPTGEEMPPGGLAEWDQVQVVSTGQTGFLLRVGYGEIEMI